ncbi:MAG: SH3 domain-containing protein [Clostridia bacterium]|nr:SH3 domain-containing protein [Clostridia bacterium]
MKRKVLMMILSVLLVASMLMAPMSASAASRKTVQILQVTVDGARVRKGPGSSYDVVTSVKNGGKVFYLGKEKDSFCYVRTDHGAVGYMYRGFLKSYGAAYKDQVYYAKQRAKVYKKASTHSSKKTTLTKGQHVIVYQIKGNWAYIKTLGGTGGYVKKSSLKKAS